MKNPASFESIISSLQSENQILRNIISLIPGNIFWKDREGKYQGCNNNVARLFGLNAPEEIIGKDNQDLFGENIPLFTDTEQTDKHILQTPQEIYVEEKGLNKYHQPAVYLSYKLPLHDDEGEVTGLLGVSLDISERKKMEAELKLAKEKAEAINHFQEEFIANMSHDIKTPLSGVIGLAELLTYQLKNHENLKLAQDIHNAGQQMLTFFNRCIEGFKCQTTLTESPSEIIEVESLFQQLRTLFLPAVTTKNLSLHIQQDAQIPSCILGASNSLYRILLNLTSNAVKFTQAGSVSLHAKLIKHIQDEEQVWIEFIVEDTGCGIPENKQHLVFERFTRLMPSYKGLFEGSGIGLDIVKNYVKAMNGDIFMSSEENVGTRFMVHLPFQTINPLSNEEAKPSVMHSIPLPDIALAKKVIDRPLQILLVEDNIMAQIVANSLLSSLQCQVEVTESAENAIEIFKQQTFDLIFMDIGLPNMQGDAATRIIREWEKKCSPGTHVPIIALTAHRVKEQDNLYFEAGMNEVLNKPLSRKQAQKIINTYFIRTGF